MQRIARFALAVGALALLAGCENKKKDVETEPAQSASFGYEKPSGNYYAPEASADDAEAYDAPVTETPAALAAPTTPAAVGTSHVVTKGDTLYRLARTYYNDQRRWKDIYTANSAVISNPDRLPVGARLTIP